MSERRIRLIAAPTVVLLLTLGAAFPHVHAEPIVDPHFKLVWERTDRPVSNYQVNRTWMWGPDGLTSVLRERYAESPGGKREVQYFDKSRMEITHPYADDESVWYVTNGLLVVEMVTGQLQVGDSQFDASLGPAEVNIVGDAGERPTYASIDGWALREQNARPVGTLITHRIDDGGSVSSDPSLVQHNVTAASRVTVPGIDHTIAAPFWQLMTSNDLVYTRGAYVTDTLFLDPYYATGFPITEAYWSRVKVAGQARDVLWQCFERRCLTYTPANPAGWQVEAGNVGLHYYQWRYGSMSEPPDSVVPGAVESDVVMRLFAERTDFTLPSNITVDFTEPGTYDEIGDLPPTQPVVPHGTVVNSYYVHADQVDTSGLVELRVTITFPEEILGVMLWDTTLIASHGLLGAETTYPRVEEIGYELTGPCPASRQDCVTLTDDRHTLILTATVYDVVDQIRVITASASHSPLVTTP